MRCPPAYVSSKHTDNERTFDQWSGWYRRDQWAGGSVRSASSYAITKRRLLSALALRGGEDVLEIGCGPGTWTGLVAPLARRLTAVDISQEMLHQAVAFVGSYPVEFVHRDVLHFTPSRAYDRVFSVRAIEYVADQAALADRLADAVADEGMLVVVTKNPFSVWGGLWIARLRRWLTGRGEAPHMRRVSPWRLAHLLRQRGFDRISVTPVIVGLPILAGVRGEAPLIPRSLAPGLLRLCNRVSDHLAALPATKRGWGLWLAESYLLCAHKRVGHAAARDEARFPRASWLR